MEISRTQSSVMRGVGILMICLHNHLHMISPVKECEFAFYPERVQTLLHAPLSVWRVVEYALSFFGWYGVAVFMFLSGYGLVRKHEAAGAPTMHAGRYLWRNYAKLLILLIPGYCLYMLARRTLFPADEIMYHVTMLSNFVLPNDIDPGVYWYFGLTMQLYVVYLLFYYCRGRAWLWVTAAVTLVAGLVLALLPPSPLHTGLRHNSVLWLPAFVMGVAVARYGKQWRPLQQMLDHGWVALALLTVLWVATSLIAATWVLSPLLAVLWLWVLSHLIHRRQGVASRIMAYVGAISAGLFVIHPSVRFLSYGLLAGGHSHAMVVTCYLAVCIPLAVGYTALYKWLIRLLNK